jgi:hypothetical protein
MGMYRLENDWVLIEVSGLNGSITRLYDKQKNVEFISPDHLSDPFRLELADGFTSEFITFVVQKDDSKPGQTALKLLWEIKPGLTVTGRIQLDRDANELQLFSHVDNTSQEKVVCLEYPIIPNLHSITENGEQDYVVHSFATGFRIHNPMKHLETDGAGFRYMPYPEGFSGSTMQFFTYYGLNRGGLYFATLDGEGYAKWLNFYKNGNGLLEASFIHGCEDIGPGKGIETRYPVVVKMLEGKEWYEAADIYKEWAKEQFWCAKGPLSDAAEEDKSSWLFEDMGAATFGINAGYDRTLWLNKYHEYISTPMFHILGPDWVHTKQNFYNGVPGGMQDWFPTKFNAANLQCFKRYGDKYAPFEFDYLFNVNGADGANGKKALQKFPQERMKSIDKYKFSLVCPADPYIQQLHIERDERLQQDVDVDSIYYDISANNILKVCMDDNHGHPIGAGRQITQAYRHNYIETKKAMIEKAGRYIPMGTEMINELFLDVLDYYQARAGAQPAAPLEGWNIKELLKTGAAELIPMFTYVYHEYGALRLDGWGKLVEEIGDLFYFTVARTYLWGGLYELNYEYSPMEAIDGKENSPEEHYYIFEPRGYSLAPERGAYISKFAKLRTCEGNKYLAYGKMLRPLHFQDGKLKLHWFQYNCDKNFKEYNDEGQIAVDSVVHSAWEYKNKSIGLFFANISDMQKTIKIKLDMTKYRLNGTDFTVRILTDNQSGELTRISADEEKEIELGLPERNVVMLEVLEK